MIDNEELPIGFTMELAMHSDVLNRFAQLSESERETIIEGARQAHRSFSYTCGISVHPQPS